MELLFQNQKFSKITVKYFSWRPLCTYDPGCQVCLEMCLGFRSSSNISSSAPSLPMTTPTLWSTGSTITWSRPPTARSSQPSRRCGESHLDTLEDAECIAAFPRPSVTAASKRSGAKGSAQSGSAKSLGKSLYIAFYFWFKRIQILFPGASHEIHPNKKLESAKDRRKQSRGPGPWAGQGNGGGWRWRVLSDKLCIIMCVINT